MSATPATTDSAVEVLRLAVAAQSDAAGRPDNQDVALAIVLDGAVDVARRDFLLLVADGMGGEPAGDVASRIAATALQEAFATLPDGDLGQALKQAYRRANDEVVAAAEANPAEAGMGTTLTSAIIHGKYATIANVGDSRAYLLRGDGLTQITRDHTLVADEVAAGRLKPDAARDDARRSVLTHAIGTSRKLDSRLPNIYELTLLPGDRLLLCSDGLYEVLDEVDIRRTLGGQEPEHAAQALVALANQRGTRDNATAVVAAAIPTRVSLAAASPGENRTGGVPGTVMAAVVGLLLILLAVLALYVLFAQR